MIAKLLPEYCGGHDEEIVSKNTFDLLYALDEVIKPMGYHENITYQQIQDYVQMESENEKVYEKMMKERESIAADERNRRIAIIDKQRKFAKTSQSNNTKNDHPSLNVYDDVHIIDNHDSYHNDSEDNYVDFKEQSKMKGWSIS